MVIHRAYWEGELRGWAMGSFGESEFWFTTPEERVISVIPGETMVNLGSAQEGYDFVLDTEDQRHVYNRIMEKLNHGIGRR